MTSDVTCHEPLQEGDEFLQYRIGSLLGRGGHAFVYAGQHRYMERPVAIKVIPAPDATNIEIQKRAQLEAQILSQVEHPNVVKIYDAGVTSAGVIYIVMEMLEGWTLRAALKSLHAFTVPETLHVGLQIAYAVQKAHAQQAIHRDLKPENVFILPGNVVKVLDFGITKLLSANAAMTTQPHLIRGTPQYMSPEHMVGRTVTVRSDIYALGSVLYELLAAVAPALIGLQEVSSYAIGYSQIYGTPPPLDELLPGVPCYVARSIQRMLAKDPEERHACMRDVADELRTLQVRFATESPTQAETLRELWHAPHLATRWISSTSGAGMLVLSSTAAHDLLDPCKTARLDAGQSVVPVCDTPARAAAGSHCADRRSSAPVPVTLQRARPRTPSRIAPLLMVILVLGSVLGYGALVPFRHAQWVKHPPDVSAGPAIAETLTRADTSRDSAARAPSPSSGVQAETPSETPAASETEAIGTTLAHIEGESMNSIVEDDAGQSHARALADAGPVASDPGATRAKKDARQKPGKTRPAATAPRPAHNEQLIFGAEDLAW